MGVAFAIHPLTQADIAQQRDRSRLEHARANALQDARPRKFLDDDALDAIELEHVRKHEPRRASADDGHLCPHISPPCVIRPATTTVNINRCRFIGQ